MISAREAEELSNDKEIQLKRIEQDIIRAAKLHLYQTTIDYILSKPVIDELKSLGYRVYTSTHYNEHYTIIYWD